MDVRIHETTTRAEADPLVEPIESYLAQVTSDFRDGRLPAGSGAALLDRVFDAPEGLVLVATAPESGTRLGMCVIAPFREPLLDESLPIVAVLSAHPDQRHRGLAKQLIEVASRTLAARGFERLGALVGHNDDALISMGERWGFVRVWEFMLRE